MICNATSSRMMASGNTRNVVVRSPTTMVGGNARGATTHGVIACNTTTMVGATLIAL
jgi:hypothetical protein